MMKKNYLWMAAMASLLSFTACSDDASPIENPDNPGEVVMDDGTTIELAVSNTGIGTRATRPVGSSAAANNVNKVQLKFYTSTDKQTWTEAKGVSVDAVDGNKNGTQTYFDGNIVFFNNDKITEGVPGSTDRIEESHKIKLSGLVKDTYYRIVAYGYNGDNFPYAGTKGIVEEATKGLFSTATDHTLSGYNLEEVFAGYFDTPKPTNASAKFSSAPRVTITRQVAGILAYFKIPTKLPHPTTGELTIVKTVKVVANDKSKGFKFPASLLTENKDFNGIDNNTGTAEEDVLITFDMEQSAKNWNATTQNDEYYTTNGDENTDNTINSPASKDNKGLAEGYTAPTGLTLKGNAFFGARYILPYEAHITTENARTLKVVMYGTDEQTALKTLSVTTNQGGEKYNYDIRCNNFYSIGKKMASGNTEGNPDPENPDPDPDKPQPKPDDPIDLGATDQIIVEINDAWDVLHDMDVEEE